MNKKKIIISVILIAILAAIAYSGYRVIAQSTNEMLSTDDSLPASFPYVTYNDLVEDPYILCCGHGITLIGLSRTYVETGDRRQSEPYLTMNDIGKKLFEESQNASGNVTSDNFTNPYTPATSRTYGYYTESDRKIAGPEEAYILAEASENINSKDHTFFNVTDEEYTGDLNKEAYFYSIGGKVVYGVDIDETTGEPTRFVVQDENSDRFFYIEMTSSGNFFPYTYVQYAWWRTEAGGNASDIQSTPFSKEAEAFAAYINKVAKRDQSGNIVYEEKTVTINGETTTVQAPVIEYAVTGDISKSDVQYDKDHEKFLIGPITLNYYEESVETERGKVDFAGMTDAKIISNIGEIDKSHWFFKFTNRNSDDKTAFPHNGEEFYIVLDYMEDLRYLSDISFDFKYMNAGGEYSELKGEYFTADWEPESEAVWCDENPSSTKKCSHGYNNKHIVQWNYWVELKGLKPGTSQPLAQVYKGARWYEDAHISLKAILPPDEDEPKEFIRLTIPMAGEVWIDKKADKKNADYIDGKREDGEEGYKNAEVYVYKVYKDQNGEIVRKRLAKVYEEDNETRIYFPIYTDENGKYEIPNIEVPGEGEGKLTEDGYDVSYEVEFMYDGQHYEASPALVTSNGDADTYINASKQEKVAFEKDSLAAENPEERDAYNNKFREIYGGNPMDKDGNTTGYAIGGDELKLEYTSEEFSLPNNENTRRLSTLTVLDEDEHIIPQYKMPAATGDAGLYFPVDNKITLDSADDVIELSVIEDEDGKTTTYKTIYDYMLHINLGVKEREKADLSTFKDLYKAEILVNEKEITKTYNKYVDVEKEENKEALNVQIEACRIGHYKLGLYSSDYEYRSTVYETSEDVVKNIKADTELKVYLTYRIAINNESQAENGLDATINQINDYYDKTFTFINEDIKANVLNNEQKRENKVVAEAPYFRVVKAEETPEYTYWSDGMKKFTCNDENKNVNDDYKKLTITDLKDIKLAAGEQLEMFITFEVDRDGFKQSGKRTELLGEKNNVAEIANYSTYYTDGKVAGIIDRDSAPDNIDLERNVKEWYEDDTESAPAIDIYLYQYNREINGNVWEDAEAVELLYGQKVANGIMDSGESGIPNIDVQLVEKIQIDGIEYEKIWSEDDFKDLTPEERREFRLKDVETANDGSYYFKGVLAGNYVVRFKYGNKEANIKYNGQDYKNTAYQANQKNEDGSTTLNNEWQDLKTSELNNARISDARDYELQRMKVIAYSQNIDNSIGTVLESADQEVDHRELIANTQMVANTAKLNIEIEHQDFIDYADVKKVNGLDVFTYIVKNIDFGLERRSGTVLDLDKKISRISLYKNDGSEAILDVTFNEDGSIKKESPNNINVGKLTHVDTRNNIQGLEYIPIESSYLNGARLKIEYTITVTNNSEVDWTGKLASYKTPEEILNRVGELETTEPYMSGEMIEYGEYVGLNYYNNKNNDTDNIVKTKVNQIIDYVDNDVAPDEEENTAIEDSSWRKITLNELRNGKMLDEKVYKDGKLVDSKGRAYITDGKSNVLVMENDMYNPSMICELVPVSASSAVNIASKGKIRIVTAKQMSEDTSKDDIYNNIAEILSYSNTVGRRDEMAVPGNSEIARGEYIAATGYDNGNLVTDYNGAKEVSVGGRVMHLGGERDADAPSYVTISEPTGISIRDIKKQNYAIAIFVSGIILAAGIIVIKKKIAK